MEKEVIFISAQPDDNRFVTEIELFVENNLNLGIMNETHLLWFIPEDRLSKGLNPLVSKLARKFKEYSHIKFFVYEDTDSLMNRVRRIAYIPLLRPYSLSKHFKKFPELKDRAIFYHDSDIILVRPIDWSPLLENDTCHLSYTGGRFKGGNYIDVTYLDNKINQCRPELVDQLKELRVIETMASFADITEDIIRENNSGTGGAQYLLKGIDYKFWDDVLETCMEMKPYLSIVNQNFFPGDTPIERENNGFQAYCTDMWAVLYNLWRRGKKTECPKVLDFSWATDSIEDLGYKNILHNAGVPSETIDVGDERVNLFFKSRYSNNNLSPHSDKEHTDKVDKRYASYYYVSRLKEIKEPVYV